MQVALCYKKRGGKFTKVIVYDTYAEGLASFKESVNNLRERLRLQDGLTLDEVRRTVEATDGCVAYYDTYEMHLLPTYEDQLITATSRNHNSPF